MAKSIRSKKVFWHNPRPVPDDVAVAGEERPKCIRVVMARVKEQKPELVRVVVVYRDADQPDGGRKK